MATMTGRLVRGLALLCSFHAASAGAQDRDAPHPSRVKIDGEPAVDWRVVGRGATSPIADCTGTCEFWALPGRYTVFVRDPISGARHELQLRVNGAREFRLVQGNDSLHDVGVGMEVAGVVVSSIGLLTVLSPFMTPGGSDRGAKTVNIGLGIMAGGIVSGLFGFGLETSYRTELVPVNEWQSASYRVPLVRLGLLPVFAGLGLGGAVWF